MAVAADCEKRILTLHFAFYIIAIVFEIIPLVVTVSRLLSRIIVVIFYTKFYNIEENINIRDVLCTFTLIFNYKNAKTKPHNYVLIDVCYFHNYNIKNIFTYIK